MSAKAVGTYQICVENSAPSQKIPAKSLARIAKQLNGQSVKSAADFGFGRLRNLKRMQALTDDLTLVDVSAQIERMIDYVPRELRRKVYTPEIFFKLRRRYQLITCIAVLHIIPDAKARTDILKKLRMKLSADGLLLIDIPRQEHYYANSTNFQKHKDGILLGNGSKKTFRKNYSADEVDRLVLTAFPASHVEILPGCGSHVRLCSARRIG